MLPFNVGYCEGRKVAPTPMTPFTVTVHVVAVPEHGPLQPRKADPAPGDSVSVTWAPGAKGALHPVSVGRPLPSPTPVQDMPGSALVTVPEALLPGVVQVKPGRHPGGWGGMLAAKTSTVRRPEGTQERLIEGLVPGP